MRRITKILLSIAILCGGALLITIVREGMGTKVSTGGIGPFIIYPAIMAGIMAVWKYNPEKNSKKDDLNKN